MPTLHGLHARGRSVDTRQNPGPDRRALRVHTFHSQTVGRRPRLPLCLTAAGHGDRRVEQSMEERTGGRGGDTEPSQEHSEWLAQTS